MRIKSTALSILVVAAVAIVGIETTSYAATGHSVILGHINHANHRTTLAREGDGAALRLVTRRGSPPLIANSRTKVTNLNADTVDGLHASALQLKAHTFVLPVQPFNNDIVVNIPVMPGVFEVVMQLFFDHSTGGDVTCLLSHGSVPPSPSSNAYAGTLSAMGSGTSTLVTANGSTVFTFTNEPDDHSMRLMCTTSEGEISFIDTHASRIILIPLAGETITNVPPTH